VPDTFFTTARRADGSVWFAPTDLARGPWDPDACHGGPPTGLLVRALELAVPAMRLGRISVDLGRTVPMAGFSIVAEVTRTGRATANTTAAILDADGKVRTTATGVHLAVAEAPLFEGAVDNHRTVTPRLADSTPGAFPVSRVANDRPGFRDAVEIRYPPGEDDRPGLTTVWMRTVPLLPDEEMSPFQRISPLADCGNAFGRNTEPERFQFINTDLVIALHRDPVGEWLGSRAGSTWQPTGSGLADALLFDDHGPVGSALQTLLVRRTPR
jgi:Acyl-CoA thioesterase C-terminal domain/Acyl-CoA thioesterase N-terminal domain